MTSQAIIPAEPAQQPTSTALARVGRKPGPRKASDVPRIPRISRLMIEVADLLASGQVKTQKEAAKLVGCSPEHISKMLQKPHVQDYLAREERRKVAGPIAGAKAAHVMVELLDDESSRIRHDVADRILTARGTLPNNKGAGITINNTNAVQVGYVLKLRDRNNQLESEPA